MYITAQGASPISEMTYTVSSGTLNPTIPYHTIYLTGLSVCLPVCLSVCLSDVCLSVSRITQKVDKILINFFWRGVDVVGKN